MSGIKTWKDDELVDRPESIKVNLLQNGVVIETKEVTADDDWKYSFTDLDMYDEEGKAYEYTIKEQAVPGYQTEIDGYDIINIEVEKSPKPTEPENLEEKPQDPNKSNKQNTENVFGNVLPNTATELFDILAVGFGLIAVGITFHNY